MGHAGSDYEPGYRSGDEITADYGRDPLLGTARILVGTGICTVAQVLDAYEAKRADVLALATDVAELPQLDSPHAVMTPLREARDDAVRATREAASRADRRDDGPAVTVAGDTRASSRAKSSIMKANLASNPSGARAGALGQPSGWERHARAGS